MARGGRTSIKGKHAQPRTFQRDAISYETKWAALQYYMAGGRIETIATRYLNNRQRHQVRNLMYSWRQSATHIRLMASNFTTARQTRTRHVGDATTLSFAAEREIVRWINSLRADGVPVSSKMLELKALEVAESDGLLEGQFRASSTWKGSFLKRHRLSFRAKNRAGQANPDTDDATGRAFSI